MKRTSIALCILLGILTFGSIAQAALKCEQMTVGSTAVGLTTPGSTSYTVTDMTTINISKDLVTQSTTPPYAWTVKATSALCQVQGAAINEWSDGSTPDATHGLTWYPGDRFVLPNNDDLVNFLAIETTATSATLNCCYFK